MKNLIPQGEMVLIRYVEVGGDTEMYKKNKAGILLPNGANATEATSKSKYEARISAVGEKVDLSIVKWKVGDKVIFNEYDVMKLQDEDENIWGLTKASSVWAVYE